MYSNTIHPFFRECNQNTSIIQKNYYSTLTIQQNPVLQTPKNRWVADPLRSQLPFFFTLSYRSLQSPLTVIVVSILLLQRTVVNLAHGS